MSPLPRHKTGCVYHGFNKMLFKGYILGDAKKEMQI
jgi:hypothetical protein